MAAPQGGYPPQEGYSHPAHGFPDSTQQPPVPPQGAQAPAAGGRKKRTYAGEAFEFGSGANAALGGQPTAGGAYGVYPPQPEPVAYQQPVYGADPTQMQTAAAGYAPPPSSGVAQMTQQFGGLGMSEPHHMPPPQPQPVVQPPRPVQLNQLYPTDLISQPFNVAELDYPPPPIILPQGVCFTSLFLRQEEETLTMDRLVFIRPLLRTALRSI